jgi:benzaldehyde dehydrogenase (NAD)
MQNDTGRPSVAQEEEIMVATAPETTSEHPEPGWLDGFLSDWQPGTGEVREVREPATGRPLLSLAQSTVPDVRRAAAAAAAAQPAWAETSYLERAAILRRAADIYEAHRAEFGSWTQRETGAHRNKMHHEQNFTAQELLNASTLPSQPIGSLLPSAQPGRLSMARRVPVGVIGAITPWNSPSVLGMRVVGPALALGNAVVLKPDPQTPVCGAAVFAAIFAEAGLPDGLLQIVLGDAEAGEALVTDPNVNLVSFTGSTEVGRRVGSLAGGLLKKVSLELGGNNAFVICDDADLDAAASAGAYSSFQFQGQVCFAVGRHIVHHSVADRYVDLLTEKAKRLRLGDPYRDEVDLGPIVNEQQLARVDGIVQRSVAGGARLAEGGTHEGLFYRPTVLADVTTDLPAWTDEIFGPVAPIVTFDSDDEAIELANSSEYGLAAGVYSRSISRGLAIANRIKAGMVHVNDQTINDEAIIPFGGMGMSGNGGRFGGEANYEAFTEWQWVTVRDEPKSFAPPY